MEDQKAFKESENVTEKDGWSVVLLFGCGRVVENNKVVPGLTDVDVSIKVSN